MSSPTRFPSGVTNVNATHPLGQYGLPDPTKWITYFTDFQDYVSGDFTTTRVGTTPTEALTDEAGGVLLLTTTAGATDSTFSQKKGESFLLAAGKRAIFRTRFKGSDATTSDMFCGLQITDTTALAVSDGVYFYKPTAAATMNLYVADASSVITTSAIATMANATHVDLAWYYDGVSSVMYYVDNVLKGTVNVTTTTAGDLLPATELTVSYGIQNGAAAIKTMSLDFIFAAVER